MKYVELFTAPRREVNGTWVEWEQIKRDQDPRLGGPSQSYVGREKEFVNLLERMLEHAAPALSNAS